MTTEYRVRLDAFEGPLDLLLYLIRRAEVDITDIPVATIADQYMEHLGGIERIDIDLAGEFLVMAATLMELKSRMIQPAPTAEDRATGFGSEKPVLGVGEPTSPGEDPRAELVRQLLAFKQFRDASMSLETRKDDWQRRFPAGRAGVDDDSLRAAITAAAEEVELEDVNLIDLVEAFSKIAASVNFDRLGEHTVTYDDTPIELHAEDILDRLRSLGGPALGGPTLRGGSSDSPSQPDDPSRSAGPPAPRLSLASLFTGRTRGEMLGLFLATLELVRRRAVSVKQDTPGGEIVLELRPPEDQVSAPGTEAAAPLDASS